MATLKYVTIGSSGTSLYPSYTNYADVPTFCSFIGGRDLIANDETFVVYVCNSETFTSGVFNIAPGTYDATHYVKIMPAPGLGVNELNNSGALDYGTVGIEWHFNRYYAMQIGHGVWITGMRLKLNSLAPDEACYVLSRMGGSDVQNTFDAKMSHNRILYVAGKYGISSVNSSNAIIEDNLFITEAADAAGSFPILPWSFTIQRNTFVNRGSGANRALINGRVNEYILRDNILIGASSTPIVNSLPTTVSNNYTNKSGTSLSGFTYNATLVMNTTNDYRPADSGVVIGAASAAAKYTTDLRGGYRGDTPDVGAVMKVAATLPAAPNGTITGVTMNGQIITVTGTYTNIPTGGTVELQPDTTPNGAVLVSTQPTFNNGSFSAVFRNVSPGNYKAPVAKFSNSGGQGTSSGGSAFTLAVPPAPTVTIDSQDKTNTTITLSGRLTNYPMSGTATLNPSGTPNGAVTKTATITINDLAQTWSVTFSNVTPGNYAPASVSVTNAGGTGTVTGALGFAVYAAGTQPPGTAAVIIPDYTPPVFNAPTVADGAEITFIKVQNLSATTINNQPFTVGMPFKKGQLKMSDSLVGKVSGQPDVTLQFDPKATWDDGSIRHGIISGIAPSIAGASEVRIGINRSTAARNNTPITTSAMAAMSLDPKVILTIGGVTWTADMDAELTANTKIKTWLAGPVCTEYTVEIAPKNASNTPHPDLTVIFAVRHFPGINKTKVDYTIEMTNTFVAASDATYDYSFMLNGAVAASGNGFVHYVRSRWVKTIWSGGDPAIHTKHDVPYVLDTKMVPNYQRTMTFEESDIAKWQASNFDMSPMKFGPLNSYMPATAAHGDIGLNTEWTTAWLMSQDYRVKDLCMKMANSIATFNMHYRDRSAYEGGGYPLSALYWPYFSLTGPATDHQNPSTGQNETPADIISTSSTGYPESAHAPQVPYIPYLLSGEYYWMEELTFWQSFHILQLNCGYRSYHKAILTANQLRGQAWSLRDTSLVAAIVPDGHPHKKYCRYIIENNLDNYNTVFVDNPAANKLGILNNDEVYSMNGGTNNGIAPWQDDFFTQSVGVLYDLNISPTKTTKLLKWKSTFHFGRMLAPGFCWQAGSIYSLQIRDNNTTPVYNDLGTALIKTQPSLAGLTCNSQQMSDALLTTINNMMGYPESPTGYPANYQPALAYSVDVMGDETAHLAWDQFSSRDIKPDYSTGPQFGIEPRTYSATNLTQYPPTAPTNVLATVNNTTVNVSFATPSSNGGSPITGYTVTASTGQTSTGTASPISIVMPVGVAVTFTVHATNSVGNSPESAASNTVTPTAPPDTTAPTLTGSITVSGITSTGFGMSWSSGSDNIGVAGYEYSINGGTSYINNSTSTNVTVSGVNSNTTYQLRVRAYDAAGNRSAPITGTATTQMGPDVTVPVMSGNVVISNVSSSGFTASWSAATDNIAVAGYQISTNGGSTFTDVGNVLLKAYTGLSPNTSYDIRVRAYDTSNNVSDTINTIATTAQDSQAPTMNGTLSFSSITTSSFVTTWSGASDDFGVAGYEISFNSGAYVSVGNVTTFTRTGASPNTAYLVQVRAYDNANNRATPISSTVTTLAAAPSAPQNVSVTTGVNVCYVAFDPPANNGGSPITSYTVKASTGETATGPASPISISVVQGVPVTFTVTANNSAGSGASSTNSNVVVLSPLVISSVVVSPANATLNGSSTAQFSFTVNKSGPGGLGTVTWTAALGTISNTGLYTAPEATDTVQVDTITATSDDDNDIIGVATVVVPVAVTQQPVRLRSYNATVRNNSGTAVEGAEVTVFDQETKAPVELWKDEAKQIQRHNPVKTDKNGYFEFFVEASQCGYTVKGFGIETYTRNNIFDVATSVDLSPINNQITLLDQTKASVAQLTELAAQKASVSDLNQLAADVEAQLGAVQTVVTVNQYVTNGTGTEASPWTGWAEAIDWTEYTQYDFEDGYYAYSESPNFAKNFLRLNGKQGTFLVHTGTNYALLCDAGSANEFVVGVSINVHLKGNSNSDGGVFMRACCYSNFDVTFVNIPGICFTEYSGVLNKYNLKRSDVLGAQSIRPVSILQSNRRVGSSQSIGNEYTIIGERATGTAIELNDCSNSLFKGGTAALSNVGMTMSATCDGNTFQNTDFNSNDNDDIICSGDFNTFQSVRSGNSVTIGGTGNSVQGGLFDQIKNTGSYNSYGPLAYGSNKGSFSDSGKNVAKRSVINIDNGVLDDDLYPTIRDLNVVGKASFGKDTMNIGDGQFYKDPSGKVGIGQTVFINDAPLQVTNVNNTANAEGLRVTLGTAALGTGSKLACLNTGGSDVFIVLGNGNTQNFNNSYGAISDIRYKENIAPATPKLDKLMQVNVVNYNLIGQEDTLLGVISQELEQVFPNMVETVPVIENGEQVGEYKAVKYSVFVPMLIVAIQELKRQLDEK